MQQNYFKGLKSHCDVSFQTHDTVFQSKQDNSVSCNKVLLLADVESSCYTELTLTCDRFAACGTFLGVQVTEALHTVRIFTLCCKRLTGELRLTTRTEKTLAMPWLISVCDPTMN